MNQFSVGQSPYQPLPSAPIGSALARNEALQCDAPNCGRSRRGLGRWCRQHAYTYDRTGHPVALHVPRREWAPFVQRAEQFVLAQLRADHRSIAEALRWISLELANAERPTVHSTRHLHYAAALLRAKRSGVSLTEFLARAIAGELADDRGDSARPRFASDQHAIHQRARLFLMPVPFGRQGWTKRKREPQAPRETNRVSFGARAYAFTRLHTALGFLALKAAAAIQSGS